MVETGIQCRILVRKLLVESGHLKERGERMILLKCMLEKQFVRI
jgi:hypothetical protein